MMKCYMENCVNNNEWACAYREDCDSCSKDCKHYYKCIDCDYYMDESVEEEFAQGGYVSTLWFNGGNDSVEVVAYELPDLELDPKLFEEAVKKLEELAGYKELEISLDDPVIGTFEQPACINCSNNPKNGGSGICHCILGGQPVYC